LCARRSNTGVEGLQENKKIQFHIVYQGISSLLLRRSAASIEGVATEALVFGGEGVTGLKTFDYQIAPTEPMW
jgi:hypothetical protein